MGDQALTPVTSSNVEAVGYDKDRKVMTVKFKNGRTYEYEGVPEFLHAQMMRAESVGKFLNAMIKPTYAAVQL